MRHTHTVDAILPVLQRYVAFCGTTTSGVEQEFGVLKQVMGEHRTNQTQHREMIELKLRHDVKETDLERLIPKAQKVWKETYGVTRHSGEGRKNFISGKGVVHRGQET